MSRTTALCGTTSITGWLASPVGKPKMVADFMHFLHADDPAAGSNALREVVQDTGGFESEFRIKRTNGAVRWTAGFGKVTERYEGRAFHRAGGMYDVTERHEPGRNSRRR